MLGTSHTTRKGPQSETGSLCGGITVGSREVPGEGGL